MRLILTLLINLLFIQTSRAEILVMACENIDGQRVNFNRKEKKTYEVDDGFPNTKQIFIYDDENPKHIRSKWQAAIQ